IYNLFLTSRMSSLKFEGENNENRFFIISRARFFFLEFSNAGSLMVSSCIAAKVLSNDLKIKKTHLKISR
ncbi:MAG: hypothetical protein ONB13_10830, partial [candidate division KSB1 bacterium]|nr:hypothetical protein [candidate division KSB1 bacterium]